MESRLTFSDLGLEQSLLDSLALLQFEYPTEIQEQAIPQLLDKSGDLIGIAQTGTGKTAAFSLPIIQQIDRDANFPQAIILSPTRELCIQICRDIKSYSKKKKGIATLAVYGGSDIRSQIKSLERGVHIIVGTPGRTIDLMKRKKLKLGSIEWLVLDEADEMLSMGFKEDLEEILSQTPEEKQTILFSATMPRDIRRIAQRYMKQPAEIAVNPQQLSTKNVQHQYFVIHEKQRYKALKRIVDFYPDIYAIIFCRTKRETQEVAIKLNADGYNSDAIHGDLSQAQRDQVMGKFRARSIQLLIATDVAARGLDVHDLTHVINFNLPDSLETYVHRSGRTGRANKTGHSLILVSDKEAYRIRHLERKISTQIERGMIPSGSEVSKRRIFSQIHKIERTVVEPQAELNDIIEEVKTKLSGLSKEELIEKLVISEFSNSLQGLIDNEDLNREPYQKQANKSRRFSNSSNVKWGKVRLSVGHKDKIKPAELITLINQNTRGLTVPLGKINIEQGFSVIDVEENHVNPLLKAFRNVKFRGHRLEVSKVRSFKKSKRRSFKRSKKRS